MFQRTSDVLSGFHSVWVGCSSGFFSRPAWFSPVQLCCSVALLPSSSSVVLWRCFSSGFVVLRGLLRFWVGSLWRSFPVSVGCVLALLPLWVGYLRAPKKMATQPNSAGVRRTFRRNLSYLIPAMPDSSGQSA